MLTFGNPEDKTSCIVLNLLKAETQRSGAAREITKMNQPAAMMTVNGYPACITNQSPNC